MTNEEAIERLQFFKKEDSITKLFRGVSPEVVTENQALIDLCMEALEKQIPRKPQKLVGVCGGEYCKCDCNHEFDYNSPYCPHCGQAIDWSDSNE